MTFFHPEVSLQQQEACSREPRHWRWKRINGLSGPFIPPSKPSAIVHRQSDSLCEFRMWIIQSQTPISPSFDSSRNRVIRSHNAPQLQRGITCLDTSPIRFLPDCPNSTGGALFGVILPVIITTTGVIGNIYEIELAHHPYPTAVVLSSWDITAAPILKASCINLGNKFPVKTASSLLPYWLYFSRVTN